jgi:pheromone shutdown protein TraB
MVEEGNQIMLQVAGGIIIAALILALITFGLVIALDRDNQALGVSGPGYWMVATGVAAAIGIIYLRLAGTI